jgi:hypothetical protein
MTTARDIIESAARKIQVLGRGQTLSADDAQNGLDALNQMLDSWSIEGGNVFTESRESFALTSGQGSYTIGSGGNFDTAKPYVITSAFVRVNGTDYPLELIDSNQYASLYDKDLSSAFPEFLYFDNNYPLSNIILWQVPATSSTLHIYSQKPLSNLTSLTTALSLPKGYERALVYNLAVELAPEYEKDASATVYRIASESKQALTTYNTRNENNQAAGEPMFSNNALRNNIYSGY